MKLIWCDRWLPQPEQLFAAVYRDPRNADLHQNYLWGFHEGRDRGLLFGLKLGFLAGLAVALLGYVLLYGSP